MAIGTFAKLISQGSKSKLLSSKNKKIFDYLDKLKKNEPLFIQTASKEIGVPEGSRNTFRNIVQNFYPNPKFITNPSKKQIADKKSKQMRIFTEKKRAGEKIDVPTPRRNSQGKVTRVDFPNQQIEKEFVKDFKGMMDTPKTNSANSVLAKKYFGETTPYTVGQIERMNTFYKGKTGLTKRKANPKQAAINKNKRMREGLKFLNESEKEILRKQGTQVAVYNQYFKNNPEDIVNYPKLKKLIDARVNKETGEITFKPRTYDDYIKIAKEGKVFDVYDFSPIASEKRNIMFPGNKTLGVGRMNQTFNHSVDSFYKRYAGSNTPEIVEQKRKIEDFYKSIGMGFETVEGRIGAKALPAINKQTGKMPNFEAVIEQLELPKLVDTSKYITKKNVSEMFKNYPVDIDATPGTFMPIQAGKKYNKGGRVGMSIGGVAKDKNKSFGGNPFGTNKVGNIESMLAGIGSGLLDIPKGAFTLGAALMDLGFGTSNAAKVENFFDDLTGLDEKAEATFAGNLTKIMVNLGVPGGFAAKKGAELTKKALLAKKNGNYFKLTDPRLVEKYGTALNTPGRLFSTLGAAGAVGVADMIFVGDPEHVGTIGDMFGGPTQLLENDENSAAREVVNRMKFGLDSSLLVGAVGATGSGLKSLIKRRDELASNNDAIDKFLGAFRPRGMTSQEFFDLNRINIGERAGDINKAGEISRSLDKHIDGIFPFVKNPFNKLGNEGRRDFMAKLNKTLLSGDIDFDAGSKTVRFGEMNKKNVDEIVSMMRDKGGKAEDVQGVLDQFGNIRAKWGDMFTRLGGIMDEDGFAKFSGIFGKKFSDYLGATYEVFKNKSLIPMLNYKPTAEAVEKAVTLFRKTAADKGAPITKEEAEHWVSKVIESANPPASFSTAAERSKGVFFNVPDFFANKSTLADIEGIGLGRTTLAIDELSDAARPVFDDLLGKIDDPMQTILTGTNKLSLVARRNELFQTLKNENATTAIARKEFLDNPDNIGKELPPELRGFFRETEAEAIAGLGRSVKQIIIDPKKTEEAGIINPLHGLYADKGTAEAIEQAAMIAQDKGTLTQLYNSFILYPKATSQMAKTILSPITHARNFISAGAFATANGLIPGLTVSLDDSRAAFKEAYGMLQTNVPGQYSRNTAEANSRYRKLLRLGVVNSGVKMQELQRLLDDVNFGDTVTGTQQLKNMTRQLSKAKKWTEDMYTAEDDFWKISSFAMERGRLKKAYQKYGMDFTDDLLDSEAASLVRNNIPNYDMVSSFVKGLRKLPFGNFVSFPAEIYRTSYNIMAQTIKEFKFQHTLPDGRIVHPFRDIAMKRGMGFGTTVLGVPLATVSAFQAIHNVSEDEMQALRRFVPDWSKNSTLVPIRGDDGKLKYIDFSHANAYDNMIRPFTTMFNGIQKGMDEDELGKNLILSMIEATKETASPFVSESIWTSAIADISPLIGRNGRTQTGRRLWTDETPAGDKFMESIRHLGATVVPGSIPAIVRMKQAVTEEVDEYGRTYEFLDEALGVAGLRAVQVDPVAGMKFKIASFRTGLNDSRREFTGPLLKGGPITAEQVVDQYQKANQAMFRVQKRMFDDYYAARILGASENQLNNTFQDRVSDLQVRHIKAGRFKPFVPSENIQKAFADNARAIKQPDAFRQASDVIKRIMRQYNNKPLGANELDILDNPFRTSLGTTVTEPFTGLQPLQDLGLTTPTVGNNLNQTAARGQQVFGPTDTIFGS